MKRRLIILTAVILIISGCTLFKEESNIVLYSDLVIANFSYSADRSAIILEGEGKYSYSDPSKSNADIIVSGYLGSSIVFLSPSKDTTLFYSQSETGYQDMGIYLYDEAPSEGYYDMEFINAGHLYFVKSQSGRYARIYIKSYSSDSIVCDMELTSDDSPVFK